MVNPIKKIQLGIEEKNLMWRLTHKQKIPEQMNHPNKTTYNLIINIFRHMPREYWYDAIKPLIWDINSNSNGVIIVNSDKDNYPFITSHDDYEYLGFNIEDLKKKRFNIEPLRYYTCKDSNIGGICISSTYVTIDTREDSRYTNKDKLAHDRAFFGSIFEYFGVANDGYTFGWGGGHHYIDDKYSFYNNFTPIKYTPKEGEFLYYLEKLNKNEITLINEDDYRFNIFGKTVNEKFILGDTSKRKYLESFFKEYL